MNHFLAFEQTELNIIQVGGFGRPGFNIFELPAENDFI